MTEEIKNKQKSIRSRAHRLSLALYAVTSHFPNEEPIRWEIRKSSIGLMQCSMSYTNPLAQELRTALKDIKDVTSAVMTYIEVLNVSLLLSDINCSILRDELLSFSKDVDNYYAMHISNALDLAQFEASGASELLVNENINESGNRGFAGNSLGSGRTTLGSLSPHVAPGKSDRQGKIVDFVHKNGPSSIRDIVAVIKGCSEKTIQRELGTMVDAGLIRREGERRWSRYMVS